MMSITKDAQRNKIMHLENSLIRYGVYNAETLSKLVKLCKFCTATKCLQNNYVQVNR